MTVYLNKSCKTGPWIDQKKLEKLPNEFGPDSFNRMLKEIVQSMLDCSSHPGKLISLVKSGHGHTSVSVTIAGSRRTVTLPHVNRASVFWSYLSNFLEVVEACPSLLAQKANDGPCNMCKTVNNFNNVKTLTNQKTNAANRAPSNSQAANVSTPIQNNRMPIPQIQNSGYTVQFIEDKVNPKKSATQTSVSSDKSSPDPSKKNLAKRTIVSQSPNPENASTPNSETNGRPNKVAKISDTSSSSNAPSITNGGEIAATVIPTNPMDWSIEDVIKHLLSHDPSLIVHAETFRKHVSFYCSK